MKSESAVRLKDAADLLVRAMGVLQEASDIRSDVLREAAIPVATAEASKLVDAARREWERA